MDRTGPRRISRSPSLKRRSQPVPLTDRVSLDKVFGISVACNAAIAVCPVTGLIAYPSGCVIVLLNSKKNRQNHIFNVSKKTITAVAFSGDGKYLVTGECGHLPCVRVWDTEERTQTSELIGHKFGIQCVAFSPNMRYIVSIGTQYDMIVNVWKWKSSSKFASNKVSSKVNTLAFSEDGSYFVTVGLRHVKFWYLDATKSRVKETVPLHGRASILGDQRNNFFTDVACGVGVHADRTFAITQSGILCEFNSKRLLSKWIKIRANMANAIAVSETEIFIGCANGTVRFFDIVSLKFIVTMPKPHYIGIDVASGLDERHMLTYPADAQYPDTLALAFDSLHHKLTCVYKDHSLYIWDVHDLKKVAKIRSYLYHSHCVWGLEIYPDLPSNQCPALPKGSFITCSSDDTIRVWNLEYNMSTETNWKRNIYSHELLKIVYTDPEFNFLCDVESAGGTDKTESGGKNGVRSIRVSPDGQHLASGDRMGNIRVHDLLYMEELHSIEAHDGEILALEFCQPKSDASLNLLVSASRDRLVHVFDVNNDYNLLFTLDDHSSSITALKFVQFSDKLQLISCGADKSLLFRNVSMNPDLQFHLHRHLVGKTTLYDMAVDPAQKFLATACQDRNVRIYNIVTGKQRKCYKGSLGDDGSLIRVQLDPSGQLMATSCSDKNLYIIDFYSGDCMSTMYGHSEIAPGIDFTNDLKHFISVSGDSCIFLWKLHPDFTYQMAQNMMKKDGGKSQTSPATSPVLSENNNHSVYSSKSPKILEKKNVEVLPTHIETSPEPFQFPPPSMKKSPGVKYDFCVKNLPSWAKKQVLGEESDITSPPANPLAPRGRWAQRLDDDNIGLKCENDTVFPLSFMDSLDRRRFTIEPDSVDSDTDESSCKMSEKDILDCVDDITVVMVDDDNSNDDDEEDEFSMSLSHSRRHESDEEESTMTTSRTKTPGRRDQNYSPRKLRRFMTSPGMTPGKTSAWNEGVDEDSSADQQPLIYYPAVQDDQEDDDDSNEATNEIGKESNSLTTNNSLDPTLSNSVDDTLSDEEDPTSAPHTPLDSESTFITDPEAKEEFLQKTYENIGASPSYSITSPESTGSRTSPTHRLSLSSRFLSRAQQPPCMRNSNVVYKRDYDDVNKATDNFTVTKSSCDSPVKYLNDVPEVPPRSNSFREQTRKKRPNSKKRLSEPQIFGSMQKAVSATELSVTAPKTTVAPPCHDARIKGRSLSISRDRTSSSPTRVQGDRDRHQFPTESSSRRQNAGNGVKAIRRASSYASLESKSEKNNKYSDSPMSSPRCSPKKHHGDTSASTESVLSQPELDSSQDSDISKSYDPKSDRLKMPPPSTSSVRRTKSDHFMRFATKSLKSTRDRLSLKKSKSRSSDTIESSDSDSGKKGIYAIDPAIRRTSSRLAERNASDNAISNENKTADTIKSVSVDNNNSSSIIDIDYNTRTSVISQPMLNSLSPVKMPKQHSIPETTKFSCTRSLDIQHWSTSKNTHLSTTDSYSSFEDMRHVENDEPTSPSLNGDDNLDPLELDLDLTYSITASSTPTSHLHRLSSPSNSTHSCTSPISPPLREPIAIGNLSPAFVQNSQDHNASDLKAVQAVEDDCHKAISDMKQAVLRASSIYDRVRSSNVVRNGEQQHLLQVLSQAFRDVQTALLPIVADNSASDTSQNAAETTAEMDLTLMRRFEPMLERYTSELSDRVLAIVEQKLTDKKIKSRETDC